ncbi:hypothetical protein Tco_0926830 [Tanacetum coccineum]|uniref:Uncharacterized protein n=1 Tax=Tanacetum coccineum TaxID=301880 RepID=A0ABQ5DB20_9ASTR
MMLEVESLRECVDEIISCGGKHKADQNIDVHIHCVNRVNSSSTHVTTSPFCFNLLLKDLLLHGVDSQEHRFQLEACEARTVESLGETGFLNFHAFLGGIFGGMHANLVSFGDCLVFSKEVVNDNFGESRVVHLVLLFVTSVVDLTLVDDGGKSSPRIESSVAFSNLKSSLLWNKF